MTVDEVMNQLKALGSEKVRELNARAGAGDNQFGVKAGDLRVLAKQIKSDHELALALWKTGNSDARMLATLIIKPKLISADDLEQMVSDVPSTHLADWLIPYVVKVHLEKEALRQKWMTSTVPMLSRAGWSLTTERVVKNPEGLDLGALLTRIESEMAQAPELARWTMNYCLAEIGINHPQHRQRALDIGERLGVYRDFPTSKGCTSPFAPIWISEMVKRQG